MLPNNLEKTALLFSQFAVEELDWPAVRPDLSPIQQLWDELER